MGYNVPTTTLTTTVGGVSEQKAGPMGSRKKAKKKAVKKVAKKATKKKAVRKVAKKK